MDVGAIIPFYQNDEGATTGDGVRVSDPHVEIELYQIRGVRDGENVTEIFDYHLYTH